MGRDEADRRGYGLPGVSIHAPAWGATELHILIVRNDSFNPRARMGRDGSLAATSAVGIQFQSTRPHGARLDCRNKAIYFGERFNPRARMGRDRNRS